MLRVHVKSRLTGIYKHVVCFAVDNCNHSWMFISTTDMNETEYEDWFRMDMFKIARADFGELWLLFTGQSNNFYFTPDAAPIYKVLDMFQFDIDFCWIQPHARSSSNVYKIIVGSREKKTISTSDPCFIIKLNTDIARASRELKALKLIGNCRLLVCSFVVYSVS